MCTTLTTHMTPMTEVKHSKKAIEYLKFPLGILYINPNKAPYEDILTVYWEKNSFI